MSIIDQMSQKGGGKTSMEIDPSRRSRRKQGLSPEHAELKASTKASTKSLEVQLRELEKKQEKLKAKIAAEEAKKKANDLFASFGNWKIGGKKRK